MQVNKSLTILLFAFTLLGCKNSMDTASASSGEGAAADGTTGPLRTENVPDPALNNMPAYSVSFPGKWHFQATLLQGGGGNCESMPFPAWRATSPDGLSFVEQLPAMTWVYGTGPKPKNNCLPLQGPVTAQDFLKYLSAMMQVQYVGDAPVPAASAAEAQKESSPGTTIQLANADVRYKNGTVAMKGFLQGGTSCTETKFAAFHSILQGMPSTPASSVTKCTAYVTYTTAPENQFAAVRKTWENTALGYHRNNDWSWAWVKHDREAKMQQNQAMIHGAEERTAAGNRAIAHTMAVQQQEHEQFLAQMQAGTDRSMARAAEVANSNHRMAQDMVDYSLDQQTVRDPSTGQLNKVSSSYNHTWIDSTGKTAYQTNDPSANPNGILPGNWYQQDKVHGDGSQ